MKRALCGILSGLGLVLISACASAPPPPPEPAWTGGDPAHLAADKTECRKEANDVDVNVSAGYSDPRYGVTSAMAASVNRDNPLANRAQITRQAVYMACMSDKGWKQP